MSAAAVTSVVFDVGKVLVDYSYTDFFVLLEGRGALINGVEDFARRVELARYEHGEMESREFLAGINRLLAEPLEEGELRTAWNNLFTPQEDMFAFATTLMRSHCRVFLLSNIGRLHWEHLLASYDLDAICDDRLASFEVGAMKPAPQIFQAAARRFQLQPEATVFIDDRWENVTGAQACGWHAVHHRDFDSTRKAVMGLLGERD